LAVRGDAQILGMENETSREAAAEEHRRGDAALQRANALRQSGRLEEAVHTYREALALRPDLAPAHNNLANVLADRGDIEDAVFHYRQALALRPNAAEIHYNLGNALVRRGDADEAAAHYIRAVGLKPDFADAQYGLAIAFARNGHLENAIKACQRAVLLKPDSPQAFAQLAMLRMQACDWSEADNATERVMELVRRLPGSIQPADLLCHDVSVADQLLAARGWAEALERRIAKRYRHEPRTASGKIRLGYLSADLYTHPLAHLVVNMFEQHDRSAFEVTAYSFGSDDGTPMRRRLEAAFERFVDIRGIDDAAVAERIFTDRIDILVDLTGYAEYARTGILVPRPAPVQVNGIGYTGTMGASFIDYIIADPFVAPMDQQPFFSERLVHLPRCYQPSDSKRKTAQRMPSRADCGLPETGFVFCCFNNRYKFTPRFFDIWMRLLHAVPGSVLWLLESREFVKDNLRRAAQHRRVNPERLVFMEPLPLPEFLARVGLADLFLDTLPYNAHTTANDALWCGLPVLTCAGATFAGRVAGSLLHAIGLPELVTSSLEDYERLALRLAMEPPLLLEFRTRLAHTAPLFDMARYTGEIEAAYGHMWERWCSGKGPEAFALEQG
jgi:predicted O-linked N-acetylglucosamine transferase (SPINDLY family)